jgi:branched-chain amino acid transport system permease protein
MLATIFNAYYLGIASFVAINALLALSVYIVLATDQLSLGSGAFMAVGAYTAAYLSIHYAMPFWLTIPAGMLAAIAVSLILAMPVLRLRGIYLAIATLGFAEVIRVILYNTEALGGPLGLKNIPNLTTAMRKWLSAAFTDNPLGLTFSQASSLLSLLVLLAILALVLFLLWRQQHSRIGRAFAAIKADEIGAEATGVNTTAFKILAFVESAALAGLAGALSAHMTFIVSPGNFAFERTVEMLLYVVLGGTTVLMGPVLGALIVTWLPEALRALPEWRLIIYGALLMVMMVVRPKGLLMRRAHKGKRVAAKGGVQA